MLIAYVIFILTVTLSRGSPLQNFILSTNLQSNNKMFVRNFSLITQYAYTYRFCRVVEMLRINKNHQLIFESEYIKYKSCNSRQFAFYLFDAAML